MLHDRLSVDLRRPLHDGNEETRHIPDDPERPIAPEIAFLEHHRHIAATLAAVDGPALVLFAVDDEGLAGTAVLPARAGESEVASLGRHSAADFALQSDPSLALRHLAVIVYPYTPGQPLRWRVIDLRTGAGMRDEAGAPLTGFEADGTAFFQVARYTILGFACGDAPLSLPSDPRRAWQAIPRRAIVPDDGPRAAPAATVARDLRPPRPDPEITQVQVLPPPVYAGDVVGGGRVGLLELRVNGNKARFVVDEGAARGGVLLGRYDRCDNARLLALAETTCVSRVHALFVQVDRHMIAIDAGSTNGLWVGERRFRAEVLRPGDRLTLGFHGPEVRWHP